MRQPAARQSGIVEPVKVLDIGLVRLARVAHPDPDPAPALDDRVGAYPRARRDGGLARHADANPVGIVFQAVIAALQPVADHLAEGKRQMAVTAAVLQRADRPVVGPVEDDRLVEQGACQRLVGDFVGGRRDIPVVLQEHDRPLGKYPSLVTQTGRPRPRFTCPAARRCSSWPEARSGLASAPGPDSIASMLPRGRGHGRDRSGIRRRDRDRAPAAVGRSGRGFLRPRQAGRANAPAGGEAGRHGWPFRFPSRSFAR